MPSKRGRCCLASPSLLPAHPVAVRQSDRGRKIIVAGGKNKFSSRRTIKGLQGYIAVFLGRVGLLLGGKHLECLDHAEAGVTRLDNIVDIAVLGCLIRICEQLGIFFKLLAEESFGILGVLGVAGIEHTNSAFCTHHCDFCAGPCVVDVAAELLAAHYDVAAAVALLHHAG